MWASIANIFTGGAVKAIETIATEFIETDMESAEAKALMVKTLDPNGLMRRDISDKVTQAYMIYLYTTMALVIGQAFGVGDVEGSAAAVASITALFVPITGMFSLIVGASFGTNISNNWKEAKLRET